MVLFRSLLDKKSARTSFRSRRLGFDHLEGRELLTTLPIAPVVETELVTLAEPVSSEFAPPSALAPSDSEPTYSQFSDEGGGGGGGGGEEEPASPPFLYDFAVTYASNLYTFSGSVIDDEDPFQLTVYFGGIISGANCTVDYDGRFSFTIELNEPSGMVTAIVQDGDGLWSNQAWTCL